MRRSGYDTKSASPRAYLMTYLWLGHRHIPGRVVNTKQWLEIGAGVCKASPQQGCHKQRNCGWFPDVHVAHYVSVQVIQSNLYQCPAVVRLATG